MCVIPKQLQNPEFRFIKVQKKGKAAFEERWHTKNNYEYDSKPLLDWVESGGNYGVVGGFGDLIIVDCDSVMVQRLAKEYLPQTFTIGTAGHGGGEHKYFVCPEFRKNIKFNIGDEDFGQIQANGKYVVGPNSTHPNGKKYFIKEDIPITVILPEQLLFAFRDFIDKPQIHKQEIKNDGSPIIPIEKLLDVSQYRRRGGEYCGSHPTHGSATRQNFHFSVEKNVWHCFRHDVGGGPLLLLAVLEGIIKCSDAKPGALRGEIFIKVLEIAQKKYDIDTSKFIKTAKTSTEFSSSVLMMLAANKRDEATEQIVQKVLKENHIYTIRNDERTEVWIYRDGIYVPQGKSFVREMCRNILMDSYTTHLGNNVLAKIEADTFIDSDTFFSNVIVDEIIVENGILNIFTRELDDFTPEKIFFNKLPIVYDKKAKCPNISKHFKTVLKNEEDVPVLEELFGFLLLKEYRFEKAFMFLGTGRNGKGKTLELMKRFIGPDNCANVPIQQLDVDMFALSELHNKMANLGADISREALKNTGFFKSLTGRDLIGAPRKFLPRVHFVNYAKMIFCANELPRTYDYTIAFWNRWILIEFPYTFVSNKEYENVAIKDIKSFRIADPEIIEKIASKDEMCGLLNVALDGLDRLVKNKDFSYSKNTEQVKNMWIRKSDSFAAFVMDRIDERHGSYLGKNELRLAYARYCKKHKVNTVSDKSIKITLSAKGIGDARINIEGNQTYVWEGINFKGDVPLSSSVAC